MRLYFFFLEIFERKRCGARKYEQKNPFPVFEQKIIALFDKDWATFLGCYIEPPHMKFSFFLGQVFGASEGCIHAMLIVIAAINCIVQLFEILF